MRRHAAFFAVFITAGVLITGVGVFFVIMGTREYLRGRASLSWPTVTGAILESEITSSTHSSGAGRTSRAGSRSRSHSASVRYVYEVGGQAYEGRRIDFMTNSSGRSAAEAELVGLERGATVTVRYHPDDPSLAVLRPGNGPYDWIPPVVGVFGIVFPAGLFLFARHLVRRGRG